MPAGLFVDAIYRSGGWQKQPEIGYGLRATRRTRTGSWHQSLTWHDALPQWRSGVRYLPEHERILTRLRDEARRGSGSTTYFTAAAPLNLDASPEVWPLLREARDAGIALLPGEGVAGPVRLLDEPAELVLHVLKADDGSGDLVLRVTTEGLPDDLVGEVLHIGDPVHGLVIEGDDGALTLVALEQDLGLDRNAVSQALAGLRVPAEERSRFLTTAVPGLRDHVRFRSDIPLPAPKGQPDELPERVQVHVHVVGDVPGELRLDLGFAYDGRPRPFTTERFGGAVRDRAAERVAVEGATSVHAVRGATWRDSTGYLHLATHLELKGVDAARFVTEQLEQLEADEHVVVAVEGELATYEEVTSAPVIRIGTDDQERDGHRVRRVDDGPTDWFDLRVSVEVAGEEVPFEPLFAALAAGDEVMLLDSGAWFRLDRPELRRLKELIEEAREIADPESGGLRLSAAPRRPVGGARRPRRRRPSECAVGGECRGARRRARRWAAAEVPTDLHATLRPYQLEGYRWLARLWDARIGGILADDMGLGQDAAGHRRPRPGARAGRARQPGSVAAQAADRSSSSRRRASSARGSASSTPSRRTCTSSPSTATSRKRGTPARRGRRGAPRSIVTSYAVLRLDDAAFHASVGWRRPR